jgi:hypothetical protein
MNRKDEKIREPNKILLVRDWSENLTVKILILEDQNSPDTCRFALAKRFDRNGSRIGLQFKWGD